LYILLYGSKNGYHDKEEVHEDGVLTCFYGTCMDNTEHYELEREMKILPESLPQMVWKIDMDGDVLYANQKFKNYVGDAEGQQHNVFSDKVSSMHKDDHKHSLAVFKKAIKEKSGFETKRRLLSAGGYYKRFTSRGIPVLDGVVRSSAFMGRVRMTINRRVEGKYISGST
jgi:PAS domain-containing protein